MPQDNRPPAFMFYPNDFSSDDKVEAMSTEAVGCYVLLLCKAWRSNPPATLPDDDGLLARWARVTEARWYELKPQVLSAWTLTQGNRWLQRRLKKEWDKQRQRRVERSTSGKKGAAKRWQSHGGANGSAIAKESETENEDEIDSSKTQDSKKSRARFAPPSVDEVRAYCRERGNSVDAEKFVNFYGCKGWMVGKNKMTDWKKAVITWEKTSKEQQQPARPALPLLGDYSDDPS
ncbi:MAG: DUF1376 domain-containing protein [Desulfurellales bacterium]|nr:MAG: DUF1376 domain-containing protein [Desulfurellales bacterium]